MPMKADGTRNSNTSGGKVGCRRMKALKREEMVA